MYVNHGYMHTWKDRQGHLHRDQSSMYICTDCRCWHFNPLPFACLFWAADLDWSWAASVQLIWAGNMLYKAAVCLLEDITSLNLAVSLTEPQALRLSRRQTRGGECIDSNAEGRQTRQQLNQTAGEKQFSSETEKMTLPFYVLYLCMETIFSAHRCTHIQKTDYKLYISPLIDIMHTWVMYAYLEIRNRIEAQISKAYCRPHRSCLCGCFSAVVVHLENLQAISVLALSHLCYLSAG